MPKSYGRKEIIGRVSELALNEISTIVSDPDGAYAEYTTQMRMATIEGILYMLAAINEEFMEEEKSNV
jgi:hypothetical protein